MAHVMRGAGFAALALSVALFAGCSDSSSDQAASAQPQGGGAPQSTLERVKVSGTVRIGYANEAPYAYLDSATNEVTGEAVEIARVVLKRMGVEKIEGVLTEFGSLIPGLQANRFDIVAAGMYVTPERCKQVLFSNPTYGVGEGFLVQKGNPKGLHSYDDVKNDASARLGVVVGAIEAEYAQKVGIPSSQVVVFPDAVSALAGVEGGRADAYAATALTINDLMTKVTNQNLEKAEPFTDPVIDGQDVRGYGAFAFRQSDTDFAQAFDRELAEFIGSPEHAKLVEPFGFTKSELPGDVTASQLCGG
ncbi:ectoine/hydroxyectoine ABC transporter substrate-binding protein EhuB [Orrella sp. JC864]|uniref:ectoine/hydroxyectoine ABC transporter substrate-binding protein EhuB n=1 Tax=Orrella sp. JC864 TaxID=3120298 RepID=UPI00300877E1